MRVTAKREMELKSDSEKELSITIKIINLGLYYIISNQQWVKNKDHYINLTRRAIRNLGKEEILIPHVTRTEK